MDKQAWQNLILKTGADCHFHPCNEILTRLYAIFESGKKQDLTPIMQLWEEQNVLKKAYFFVRVKKISMFKEVLFLTGGKR
jgi:hypothetical protein